MKKGIAVACAVAVVAVSGAFVVNKVVNDKPEDETTTPIYNEYDNDFELIKFKNLVFAGDINDDHVEKMSKRGLVASKGLGMPRSAMMPYLNIENKDKLGKEELIDDKYVKPVYLEKSQAEKMKK